MAEELREGPVIVPRTVYEVGELLDRQSNQRKRHAFELAEEILQQRQAENAAPESVSFWKAVYCYLMERASVGWDVPTIVIETDNSRTIINFPEPALEPK
jgi:hypothetical protein